MGTDQSNPSQTTPHNPTSSRQLVERDTSSSSADETKSTLKLNRNIIQSLQLQSVIYCNINDLYNTRNKCKQKLLIPITETHLNPCRNEAEIPINNFAAFKTDRANYGKKVEL